MQQHVRRMPRLAALWLLGIGIIFVIIGCGGSGNTASPLTSLETAGTTAPHTTINNDTNTGSTESVSTDAPSDSPDTGSGSDTSTGTGSTDTGSTEPASEIPVVLTEDETMATNASDQASAATNGALEQVSYLTESEGGRSVTRAEGEYPKVSTERTEEGFVVTVDYGTIPVTTPGGREVSGVFTITRNRVNRTGTVVFTDVSINGRTISGSTSLTNLEVTRENVSSTLTYDLTIGKIGRSAGTSSLTTQRATRLVTITTGSHTITPEGSQTSYTVVPSNLVLDPVNNGNLVPESGTRTITYSLVRAGKTIPITVVVAYTAESPLTGVVSVSTNGGEPIPYTLPRFR